MKIANFALIPILKTRLQSGTVNIDMLNHISEDLPLE
ncbi:hypothetical protein J2Z57_002897 [Formosa algae]|uniref:Uncharacterized protein n=1 Tax=Formosa algae TaxID=225843 RepID=A0A9X0YPS8_9FLAO|nr:hypothetical protein [Formosa algae]MDQ0336443.1 hypothetical protein [Formosa algae]